MKSLHISYLPILALIFSGCDSSSSNSTNNPTNSPSSDLPAPTITVARTGTTIFDTLRVTISSTIVGGLTRYTLDGTEPNQSSPKYDSQFIAIDGATKISAKTWFGTSTSNTAAENISYKSSWNPSIAYGSVTDSRDGKIYKTVTIGTQTWFAENLNYKTPKAISIQHSSYDSIAIGDWCYDNDDKMCSIYGRLYSWPRAMNIPDSCGVSANDCSELVKKPNQGICPTGWHVPDSLEWSQLLKTVGINSNTTGNGYFSTDSVAIMKLAAIGSWNNKGTDDFGFRILPSGGTSNDVNFKWVHSSTLFVSAKSTYRTMYGLIGSLQYDENSAWLARSARTMSGTALFNSMSLRCIKD